MAAGAGNNQISNMDKLMQDLLEMIPAPLVMLNSASNQIATLFIRDADEQETCGAKGNNHELVYRSVAFCVCAIVGIYSAKYRNFRDDVPRIYQILYKVFLYLTMVGWLLCTSPEYLVCFQSGGDGKITHKTYDLISIASGILLMFWAVIALFVENKARKNFA